LISPSSAGSGSSVTFPVFHGFFIAEKVDRVGEKRWEDTTMFDAQTLLKALIMSLRSACFIDEAFFFFFWYKSNLPVVELLSSSAKLSGFPYYQISK
jgi:hypothetical protein